MFETALLQLVAYATLTLMGLCIAGAALLFSYRQNFGWTPILLVTSHGVEGVGGQDEYIARLDFEFWNRRRYPVVIRMAEVDFGELRLYEKVDRLNARTTWGVFRGKPIYREDIRVEPAAHHQFKCRGAFAKRPLDNLDVRASISVYYFDPVANKEIQEAVEYRYTFRQECD